MNRSVILLGLLLLVSCDYKRDDDALPVCDNRSEIVTVDILRKWCVSAPFVVDNDVAVEGVVVANDRGGNFNKTFVIQSDMGGVEVLAGFYSLSTNYPVGRNLHLQLKGLTIEMRNGLITAGVASGYDNHARPDYFFYPYLLRQHICGDYKMTSPEVLLVSASDLKNELCGKLVQINGLKYSGDSKCWGDGDIPHSFHTNDHIVPMVMIRTSKYCDFAQGYIPSGIVNIRGILYKEMVAGAPYFVIKPINISDIETM